jgi:hypothetical protein
MDRHHESQRWRTETLPSLTFKKSYRSLKTAVNEELAEAEIIASKADDDRDRIQLCFNELTRSAQSLQRERDQSRVDLEQAHTACETE